MKNINFSRLVCFLLVALMILPMAVACADTTGGEGSDTTSANAETQAPAGSEAAVEVAGTTGQSVRCGRLTCCRTVYRSCGRPGYAITV